MTMRKGRDKLQIRPPQRQPDLIRRGTLRSTHSRRLPPWDAEGELHQAAATARERPWQAPEKRHDAKRHVAKLHKGNKHSNTTSMYRAGPATSHILSTSSEAAGRREREERRSHTGDSQTEEGGGERKRRGKCISMLYENLPSYAHLRLLRQVSGSVTAYDAYISVYHRDESKGNFFVLHPEGITI